MKRAHPETPAERVERDLQQALGMMSAGGRLRPEEWMLLATLVGDADLALRAMPPGESAALRPLFDRVMTEFHDLTAGFTRQAYLDASRAARRRNPALLNPR